MHMCVEAAVCRWKGVRQCICVCVGGSKYVRGVFVYVCVLTQQKEQKRLSPSKG